MNEGKELTLFDKKKEYEIKVLPLVKEIIKQCAILNIPVYISTAVANTPVKTTYENLGNLPGYGEIFLKTDYFAKYLLVANGFDVKTSAAKDELEDMLIHTPIPTEEDYEPTCLG